MFDNKEHDLMAYLAQADRLAVQRCNGNQIEAKELAARYVENSRNFDAYDAKKLVERVQYCRGNGARLDLNDPTLRKNGTKRPLDRSGW